MTYVAMAITTEESSYCDPDCWMRRAGWSWPVVQGGIYKWRLTDGQVVYSVTIKDPVFLKRVNNNELAFAKGDVLFERRRHDRVLSQRTRHEQGSRKLADHEYQFGRIHGMENLCGEHEDRGEGHRYPSSRLAAK